MTILSINLSLYSFEQCFKVFVEFSVQNSPQRYKNFEINKNIFQALDRKTT